MEPISIVSFILKNWKVILGTVIFIAIIGVGIGAGIHYKGLVDNKAVMTSQLEKKDVELKNLSDDIKAKDAQIDTLVIGKDKAEKDNSEYVKTIARLQKSRNDIQGKYNELLERINNVKLPLNDKGTLSEPVVLIDAGLPVEYIKLKQSTGNNSPRNP